MTSDAILAARAEEAGADARAALRDLSLRFWQDEDPHRLAACARLLPHFEGEIGYYNDALWRIISALFLATDVAQAALRDEIMHDILRPSYHRFIDAIASSFELALAAPLARLRKRILFVSHFLLNPTHSPTMVAVEYARGLEQFFPADVLILNARLYPGEPPLSDFVGGRWALGSGVPDGFAQWKWRDAAVKLYSCRGPGLSRAKIAEAIEAARRFAPDIVISHGHFNAIGDVLARRYPTVCMETTRAEPVSFAHGLILLDGVVKSPVRVPPPAERRPPPKLFSLPAPVPVRDRTATYARQAYGLAPDDFVFIMVGHRLTHEITEEFEGVMRRILAAVPKAVMLQVGDQPKLFKDPQMARFSERIRHIAFEPDLRALYAICDCYLNPPRQGGGASATMALAESLPIITLRAGDVVGVASEACAVADLDAMAELAIRYARDPAAHAAARARAAAIFEQRHDFDSCVMRLWDILGEAEAHVRAASGG